MPFQPFADLVQSQSTTIMTTSSVSSQRLTGVIAIVTGGGQGFGRAIVEQFVAHGAQVLSVDLTAPGNGVITGVQPEAYQMNGDVTSEKTWHDAVAYAKELFKKAPNVVVNNAGWTYSNKPTLSVTEDEFDRVFNINVKSIYLSAKVIVPVMQKASTGGSFIQISSTAAIRPRPQLTWYNASKGAVSTASKAMALEFAKDKIRFNCVNPVAGNTPLLSKFAGAKESGDTLTAAQLKQFNDSVPLGRLSEGTDIANACLFLADPKSEFISGIDLPVDGGRCV
ncbi:NAD(P)-binding protein [Tilletiaria anomala UBC 951]|uniref:NAD(P)-binding protein n=1 Tax=Tilletiaria anomala (strain ATCC 24038 / CBS 436.72 / UBC 951) TaxID=1037660 RepID=A0A066WE41_TILAU|nr:NAD(P)-binding protein [Tilletiaria anomala UBC 951]KDN52031.1 NAD(P)-binding protein [Tilletiaria anomala UBC 951]